MQIRSRGLDPWQALLVAGALLSCAWPAPLVADVGGPDAYGWTWRDGASGGPDFLFEAPDNESRVALPGDGDDQRLLVGLPFSFDFAGQTWSELYVHDNGGVTFGLDAQLGPSHTCPVNSLSAPAILPFWEDLAPQQGTDINSGVWKWERGEAGARVFVVEWYRLPIYNVPGAVSFQLKFFEADNHVEFHYLDVHVGDPDPDAGAQAYVGTAHESGALAWSCDQGLLSNELALGWYPPTCVDDDGDGWTICVGDCDDTDDGIYPGALEACDGLDNDCDGEPALEEQDADGDGFSPCQGDCDDANGSLTPEDADEDGASSCDGDCDDSDASRRPGDLDGDGYDGCGDPADCNDDEAELNRDDADGDGQDTCAGDCDDGDPSRWLDAPELCDELDNDCDGEVDENPNCDEVPGDDDDDDTVAPVDIPYGCLFACNQGGAGGGSLALLLLLGVRRRR